MASFMFNPADYPDLNKGNWTLTFPDFREVKALLARHIREFLPLAGFFKDGTPARDIGSERHTLNPMRNDKTVGSFSANLDTGAWIDRATGDAGSVLDLWAGIYGIDIQEGARKAMEAFGMESTNYFEPIPSRYTNSTQADPGKEEKPCKWAPAPAGAVPPVVLPFGYSTSTLYRYETAESELAFVVVRFDGPKGKTFGFFHYTSAGTWTNAEPVEFKGQRPLFNLPHLAHSVDLPVFLVEGEKCAEAVERMPLAGIVSTWACGVASIDKTAWTSLEGRRVVLWPDNDKPGSEAMDHITEKLLALHCRVFRVPVPKGKPPKWDAWDCLHEDPTGLTGTTLVLSCTEVKP